MSAVSLVLFVVSIVQKINEDAVWIQYLDYPLIYFLIFILFILSYKKQVGYTVERIRFLLENDPT